jgi:hypothetical protein
MAQRFLQCIDIAGHDVPNASRVGAEVLVHNSVANTRDGAAWNVRMRSLEYGSYVFRGLSDDRD